jgi:hypothetical protein
LDEFSKYRGHVLNVDNKERKLSNQVNTSANTENEAHFPTPNEKAQRMQDSELYRKICEEFIQIKFNYDRLKTAQLALRNTAMEQSSLDNLIKASLNPIGAFSQGPRFRNDSLLIARETGRKRAMTCDGPVKTKYVHLNHTKKSAFSSFKHVGSLPDAMEEEKNDREVRESLENIEVKLSRKRTHAQMEKDFPSNHPQLLLSSSEDVSNRKRAKSF